MLQESIECTFWVELHSSVFTSASRLTISVANTEAECKEPEKNLGRPHQFNLPPHCIKQIDSAQTRVSGLICGKLARDLRLPVDGIPFPYRLEANSRKRSLASLCLQIQLRPNYTIDSTSMQQKERDKSDEEEQGKDRNGTEDATTSLGASTSVTACSMSEVSKPQTGGGLGNRLYLVGPLRFLS